MIEEASAEEDVALGVEAEALEVAEAVEVLEAAAAEVTLIEAIMDQVDQANLENRCDDQGTYLIEYLLCAVCQIALLSR